MSIFIRNSCSASKFGPENMYQTLFYDFRIFEQNLKKSCFPTQTLACRLTSVASPLYVHTGGYAITFRFCWYIETLILTKKLPLPVCFSVFHYLAHMTHVKRRKIDSNTSCRSILARCTFHSDLVSIQQILSSLDRKQCF